MRHSKLIPSLRSTDRRCAGRFSTAIVTVMLPRPAWSVAVRGPAIVPTSVSGGGGVGNWHDTVPLRRLRSGLLIPPSPHAAESTATARGTEIHQRPRTIGDPAWHPRRPGQATGVSTGASQFASPRVPVLTSALGISATRRPAHNDREDAPRETARPPRSVLRVLLAPVTNVREPDGQGRDHDGGRHDVRQRQGDTGG